LLLIFAGISGAALADAAGLGMAELETMTKAGFPRRFSAAIIAAYSPIGFIIAPSIFL